MVSIRLFCVFGSASSWSNENKAPIGTSSAFASSTVFSKDGLLRLLSRLLRYLDFLSLAFRACWNDADLPYWEDLRRKAQNAIGQIPPTDHDGMTPWLGLQLEGLRCAKTGVIEQE